MNDALLIGYYGHRNTGDDAFVAVTAWGAQRFLGAQHMLATARHLPQCYQAPVRPLYWSERSRLRELQDRWAAARSRRIVFGGGSNFHKAQRMEQLGQLLDRCHPGPHVAVGVSIGPFRDAAAEKACARLLGKLAFVGVRDQVSYERVRELAPQVRVELTFDLAVLLAQAAGQSPQPAPTERRGLGVALCNYERFVHGELEREPRRVAAIAEALRQVYRQDLVDEIVLIDFNGHPRYGDAAVHQALAAQLDGLPVRRLSYCADPAAVLASLSRLRGVLAMRLHAAVFAYCAHTPCAILSYHEKCRAWADLTGHPAELVCDAAHPQAPELQAALQTLLSGQSPCPQLPVADAVGRALLNWTGAALAGQSD